MNAVYTCGSGNDGTTYTEARAGYDHSPALPAFLLETGYEAEGWSPGEPASIRKYGYCAVLSGATAGCFYGHRDIWNFATASWSTGYPFGHQPCPLVRPFDRRLRAVRQHARERRPRVPRPG